MRNFVLETLPQLQRGLPKILNEKAERSMETEMDSNSAIAVSSDGRVASTGLKGLEADEHAFDAVEEREHQRCDTCGHGKTWSISHSGDQPDVKISVLPPSPSPNEELKCSPKLPESPTTKYIRERQSSAARSEPEKTPSHRPLAPPTTAMEKQVDLAWRLWAT